MVSLFDKSVTDKVYCTYLSDLAVHSDYQHQGFGKELIRKTKAQTSQATLILLSAPAAVNYYPKIGMGRHEHTYVLKDVEDLQ